MHKNSGKIYAIKKIAFNKEELEKAFIELKSMKGLKSPYFVELIDSWIEENSLKFEDFKATHSTSDISSSHPIFNPKNNVLLHIQMEYYCETLNEVMKQLSNELMENNSEMMKTFCYFICCELLTEIIECAHYLHERNVIHRNLKTANIFITDGTDGRFLKLANPYFNHQCSESINFMAPEVTSSQKYDMKADIYSIGRIIEQLFFFTDNL
jgi:serine/threonine protein kinase